MRRASLRFLLVFVAATCPTVSAEPISYSEVVAGDLGELPSSTVFSLEVGTNTFTGRLGVGPGFSDYDSFAFSVPSGTTVTSISYSMLFAAFQILRL